MSKNEIQMFTSTDDLKIVLAKNYQKQIENFFGDPQRALEFLSNVVATVQRTPKLLECSPASVINAFITMASLKLMPSSVSGEAYVIPYGGIAQFQLGYQGLVTLFYRAGVRAIYADIVRENDVIEIQNLSIRHVVDPKKSMAERGKPIGAYAVINYNGEMMGKYMNAIDIIAHGKRFSKSFTTKESPWNQANDHELWMWKKTVLKQAAKLVPKNETINKAIDEDNKDSVIADRLDAAEKEAESLKMGNLLKSDDKNKNQKGQSEEDSQSHPADGEPIIQA